VTCKACGIVLVANAPATPNASPQRTPAPEAEVKAWYVAVKREQRGPLSRSDVTALITDKVLSPRSYAWKPGMPEWIRLGNIDEFHDALVVQRAQMALSEPSYAAYVSKITGDSPDESIQALQDAATAYDFPLEAALAAAQDEMQHTEDEAPSGDAPEMPPPIVNAPQEEPQAALTDPQPDRPPEPTAEEPLLPEQAERSSEEKEPPIAEPLLDAAETPPTTDSVPTQEDDESVEDSAPLSTEDEIDFPHAIEQSPEPVTEVVTAAEIPPEPDTTDPNAMMAATIDQPLTEESESTSTFDDTATMADEPLFTSDTVRRAISGASFRGMDTQITEGPRDADLEPSEDDEETTDATGFPTETQTVDEKLPSMEGIDGDSIPPADYTGPAEPFPPMGTPGHTEESEEESTPSPTTESVEQAPAEPMIPAETAAIDVDHDNPDHPASDAEAPIKGPATDEQEMLTFDPIDGQDNSPDEDGTILDVDDLLAAPEVALPPSLPPSPNLANVVGESVPRGPDTDDDLHALEGDFFERADDHVEMENALDRGVLHISTGPGTTAERLVAGQAELTEADVQDLSRTLGTLVRREKQSRRIGLASSVVILAIIAGLSVAGAQSVIDGNKDKKRRTASNNDTANPVAVATTPVPAASISSEKPQPPKKRVVRPVERITELDWDELETPKQRAKKSKQGAAKASTGSGSHPKKSTNSAQRTRPRESIDSDELKRLAAEDRGKKDLVVAMETKAAEKTRAVNSETISKLIGLRMRRFERCARRNSPNMTVKLSFDVLANGQVSNIRVRPSTGPDRVVESCVRGIITKWSFPPSGKKQTFRRTLVLQ